MSLAACGSQFHHGSVVGCLLSASELKIFWSANNNTPAPNGSNYSSTKIPRCRSRSLVNISSSCSWWQRRFWRFHYFCFLLWFQFRVGVILLFYMDIKFRFQLRREPTTWVKQLLNLVPPYLSKCWHKSGRGYMHSSAVNLSYSYILGKRFKEKIYFTQLAFAVCASSTLVF